MDFVSFLGSQKQSKTTYKVFFALLLHCVHAFWLRDMAKRGALAVEPRAFHSAPGGHNSNHLEERLLVRAWAPSFA